VEKQQQAVDEFKIQHEREKKEALAAFDEYKSKVKTRETGLKSECEDKVGKAAAMLESVKGEFKKRVDEFNAAVKKMEAQGGSQVEDIRKKHKKEMADHVTESNAKYNEMLKERMNEEDKLHDEVERLKKELAAASAKALKDAESEIAKRVKNAKVEAEEAKIAELEKLRKKHDMLNMSLEEDSKRKTKSIQEELDAARAKASDLLSQLQQLQNAGASSDKDRKKLEDDLAALKKALDSEKERAQKTAQETDAKAKLAAKLAEDQIKQAHSIAEDVRKHAQQEQDKLRKEIGELFAKLAKAEEAGKAAAQKLQDELGKGADKLRAQLAEKDGVIATRDATISELQKKVKDGEKGASEQLAELKKSLAEKEKEVRAALAEKEKEVKNAEAAAKKLEKDVEGAQSAAAKTSAELEKCKVEKSINQLVAKLNVHYIYIYLCNIALTFAEVYEAPQVSSLLNLLYTPVYCRAEFC